ncbi:uncharacterized protein LOC127715870 [Mytilus californianus]|uniref:uncharacterized protein LOC127715870 n=1 Tax=Mytilus californianus TaxID=6549 RepID=UPI002245750F|nr:uncharacterized protein LOC127715870 [Mytilus californianus]
MIALGGEGMSAFNLSLNEGFDLNISTKETEFKTITRNAVYLIELVSIIENDTLDNWLEDEKIAINVRYGTLAPMTVYPISSLGKDYKAITYCQILGKCFIILSTLPATTVEVKVALPETSKSSRKIELTFNATKYGSGETILFALSGNYTAIIECACDLTGTFISSNGTIAVFAGGRDTVVRWGNKEKTFITQLLPLNTWGKEFILIDSDIDDFGDTIRVISRYNNTVVKMNGYKTVTMHAMSHFIIQRSLQRGSTLHLSSSKPTMVCQIVADGFKQPTMINIPPAEHFFNTELSIPCTFCNHLKLITNGYNDSIKIKGGGMTQFKLVSKSGFTVMHFDHEYMFDNNDICVIQSKNIPFALLYTNMSSNRYMKFHYIGSTDIQTKSQPEDEDGNGTNEDTCIDLTDTSSHGKCFVVPVLPIWKDGYCQLAISPKRNDTEQINYINGEVMEPNETSNGEEMTVIKITTEDKSSINFLWYNNEAKQAISTLLFPIDVFGLEYYAASYCPQSAYCVSYCIITAIYDNTHVKVLFEDIHYIINITEFGISDYSVDNTSRINLAIGKYKYALVKSERDLTGTYIWADNRVSVICGANFNNTAVAEQLYPVQFFKSGSYSYILRHDEDSVANYNIRIMTSAWVTSCRLTISESLTFFEWEIYLDKPGHYEQIAKGEIDYIEDISCDQPVFVWVTVINNVGSGFMVIIPSTDHIMDTYNFKTFQNLNGNASEHKLYGYVSNIDTTSVLSSFKVNPYTIDRNFDHNRSILLRPDTFYRVNFDNNTHDHVLWYAGSYNGIAFGSCVGMKFSEVENCILHETEDTDCDGLIHEDICTLAGYNFAPPKHLLFSDRYIADYDLDGNYDEDCAFTLPECYAPNIKNGGSEDIPQSYTHVTSKLSNLYCNSGYTAEVDVESITCEADGIWKPNYICQKGK